MAKLAQVLREVRARDGWTRREVAEAAGIAENTIRDYEQSKREPSLENAARLAVALGVPLTLLGDAVDRYGAYALPKGKARGTRTAGGLPGVVARGEAALTQAGATR